MRFMVSIFAFIGVAAFASAEPLSNSGDMVAVREGNNLLIKVKPFEFVRSCIHGDGLLQKEKAISYEEALVFYDYYTVDEPITTYYLKHIVLEKRGIAKDGACTLDLLNYSSNIQTFVPTHGRLSFGKWTIEMKDAKNSVLFENKTISSVQ